MSGQTPGPWLLGHWGGQCHISEHVEAGRHPGPAECVYDPIFYPSEGDDFIGIAASKPGVDIVWTEYDELKIRPEDARLIAAAPELLEAAKVALAYDAAIHRRGFMGEVESQDGERDHYATGDDLEALYLDWMQKSRVAIAKAEGAPPPAPGAEK